jgi:Ca2+ transporting ATPase
VLPTRRVQLLRYSVIGAYVGCATVFGFIWAYIKLEDVDVLGLFTLPLERIAYSKAPLGSWGELTALSTSDSDILEELDGNGDKIVDWKYASSVALTVLVVIEMFNACNSVSEGQSVLRVPPFVNPYLIAAIALSMTLHVGALYFETTRNIFKLEWLDQETWIFVIAISVPVIILDEIFKLIGRIQNSARLAALENDSS